MAMIGRNAAIAEVGKHRHQVEGPLAFAAWLGVHAMLLSGTHSKTDAFLTWAWDYFDRDQPLDQQRAQLLPVGRAVLVAREARVVDQLGHAEDLAQLAELAVVAGGDDQLAVAVGSGS